MQFFDIDANIEGAVAHFRDHSLTVLRRSAGGRLHAIRSNDDPCEKCRRHQDRHYMGQLLFVNKGDSWAGPWVDTRTGLEVAIIPTLLVHFAAPFEDRVEHVFSPLDIARDGMLSLSGDSVFYGIQLANVAPGVRFPLRTASESTGENNLDYVLWRYQMEAYTHAGAIRRSCEAFAARLHGEIRYRV